MIDNMSAAARGFPTGAGSTPFLPVPPDLSLAAHFWLRCSMTPLSYRFTRSPLPSLFSSPNDSPAPALLYLLPLLPDVHFFLFCTFLLSVIPKNHLMATSLTARKRAPSSDGARLAESTNQNRIGQTYTGCAPHRSPHSPQKFRG